MAEVKLPQSVDEIPELKALTEKTKDKPVISKTPVAAGKLVQPSLGKRVKQALFSVDEEVNLKDYIIFDMLLPTVKDFIADIFHNSTDIIFYGRRNPDRRRSDFGGYYRRAGGPNTYISYEQFYRDRVNGSKDTRRDDRGAPNRISNTDVMFDTREQAEEVLSLCASQIMEFGRVRVADLYEWSGVSGGDFVENDWGWYNVSGARIRYIRDRGSEGWLLEMPRAVSLK